MFIYFAPEINKNKNAAYYKAYKLKCYFWIS